ncbi:mitochondrial pyruvate carrier 1-like protein [Tanacetum coccineum]
MSNTAPFQHQAHHSQADRELHYMEVHLSCIFCIDTRMIVLTVLLSRASLFNSKVASNADMKKYEAVMCGLLLKSPAATLSRTKLGGPLWKVKLGRRDSTTASQATANANLPSPFMDLPLEVKAYLNSPIGPKTTHFWGPVVIFGFVASAMADIKKPPEMISGNMTAVMCVFSALCMRFVWVVLAAERRQDTLIVTFTFVLISPPYLDSDSYNL